MCANDAGPGRGTEYKLNNGERIFLRDDDSGSEHPSRRREGIKSKANLLPERFEALFEDVELLHDNGYSRKWTADWIRFLELKIPFSRDDLAAQLGTDETKEQHEFGFESEHLPAMKFGRSLGRMASQLPQLHMDRTDLLIDIVWGFVGGISPSGGDDDKQFETECVGRLQERIEVESIAHAQAQGDAIEALKTHGGRLDEEDKRVREALEEEEIEQGKWLTAAVKHALKKQAGIRDTKATPLSVKVSSVEDTITPERIREIVEENNFIQKQQLLHIVEKGYDQIKAVEQSSVPATEVLSNVPSDSYVSTREIAEEIDTVEKVKTALPPVAKIGLYLSGKRDIDGGSWDGPPLLVVDDSSADILSRWQWSLRPYGQIVKHRVQTDAQYPGLPTPTIGETRPLRDLPKQIVEEALDELDTSDPERDPAD